jgi:hypothetical protein
MPSLETNANIWEEAVPLCLTQKVKTLIEWPVGHIKKIHDA